MLAPQQKKKKISTVLIALITVSIVGLTCRGARGNVTLSAITWCARLGSIPTPGTGSFHPVAIETAVEATKLSELSMERVANRRQRAPPVVCLQTVQRLPKFPSHFRSGCAKCVQNVTFVLCLRFRARQ